MAANRRRQSNAASLSTSTGKEISFDSPGKANPKNMIHLHRKVGSFRMGNWDRSEQVLESLLEDFRLRKQAINPSVMSIDGDLDRGGDKEPLHIDGYMDQMDKLQKQMAEFKQRFHALREETDRNSKDEILFFDSWIQFEQKRLPLIQKRADALIRYDAEALDQHETEITANFQEFQEITHFPESFVQEQLNRLCGKPTSDPKRRQVLNYFEGLIQRNDESDYGDLQTATDDVSIIGETDPDVSVEMES